MLIVVVPKGHGRYQALYCGVPILSRASRTPFFDAARQLLADGFSPNELLVMRHQGQDFDALMMPLGKAATLTVEEGDRALRFRLYEPDPRFGNLAR